MTGRDASAIGALDGMGREARVSRRPLRARRDHETVLPVRLGYDGDTAVISGIFRLAGSALVLAAPGLWLIPGSSFEADLALMKLWSSVFFAFCGIALLMRNKLSVPPDVIFDPIRRELRVEKTVVRARPQTLLRRRYESLGRAVISPREIELWDVDGSVLMRLPIPDAETRCALRDQLGQLCRG